jgi:flagellar hook assembly protein FlgD
MEYTPATTFSARTVYPNPFEPAKGHTSMTFTNVPAGAKISIYTLTGELVKEITAYNTGTAAWDGTNSSGNNVSTGIYFALIKDNIIKTTLKLAVIR